jgi:glycosyltransferase involved in cell wall biosynthesis
LRVALVLPSYFQNDLAFMGGGDRYVHKLAQALLPHCDVTFFTFGPRYRQELFAGVRHVVLPGRPGANPDNPVPYSLDFVSRRFDVVHCFHLRTVVTNVATLVRRATRRPMVVTDLGGGGRSATFKLQLYRLIPALIAISEYSRSLLPVAAQARTAVIKGGIDPQHFAYDDRPRERQVLQVSRLMPHKGQNYLIEAAGQDLPVVIAGKIVNRAYYEDLRKMASGKPVRFLIDVDDNAILDEYRRSAVTVQASVYRDLYGGYWPTSELLGLPLLESMSVGTPVISTDVGGMPEFVRDGVTGFVVPPSDPVALRRRLDELLSDPARASSMGRAGSLDMAQYSWDAVARRVGAEYARLMA